MPRLKLDMTPDERREHVRTLTNKRKQKQRKNEKEKKMAEPLSPDLEEFAEELLKLRLPVAVAALGEWQAVNRKRFPALPVPPRADDEAWPAFYAREKRARRFALIRLMAMNHKAKEGDRERKRRFIEREAKDAESLGMTVDAYRKHKKHLKLAAKMEAIAASRAAA